MGPFVSRLKDDLFIFLVVYSAKIFYEPFPQNNISERQEECVWANLGANRIDIIHSTLFSIAIESMLTEIDIYIYKSRLANSLV